MDFGTTIGAAQEIREEYVTLGFRHHIVHYLRILRFPRVNYSNFKQDNLFISY